MMQDQYTKVICISIISSEQSKKEIKKTIPSIIASKRKKKREECQSSGDTNNYFVSLWL